MLPTELRCRIYDYVFGSNLVRIIPTLHIELRSRRIGYEISMCTCEHDHTQLSPRVRGYDHGTEPDRVCTDLCQNCTTSGAQRSSASKGLSLPLLQVSRQIYHEAVLKPFQQAFFILNCDEIPMYPASYGLPAFMNALAHAQVKAITRLRLLSASSVCICYAKLPRLQGLKHLKLQLDFKFIFADSDSVIHELGKFAHDSDMRSLVKLHLNSVRIEIGLDGPNSCDRAWAELTRKNLTSPTQDDAKILEEVLKRTEADLLGFSLRESA